MIYILYLIYNNNNNSNNNNNNNSNNETIVFIPMTYTHGCGPLPTLKLFIIYPYSH